MVAVLICAACGEDKGVSGPAAISTSDGANGGLDATNSSSSGGNRGDAGPGSSGADGGATIEEDTSSTGASSSGASSGGSTDAGLLEDGASSSGGTSSGGNDAVGQFVCVNDFDCKALMTDLPACQTGRCLNNVCVPGPAEEGDKCDDGTACTKTDTCVGGTCQGADFACDDGNPCTEDSCDAATGKCDHPSVAAGFVTKCDDGDPCTAGDTCKGSKCVGAVNDCDDGNPCTDDKCLGPKGDVKGGCQYTNNTKPCGDADKCFSAGQCSKGQCKEGKQLTCDDDNDCTTDTCDPKTACQFQHNALPCTDNDVCTEGDRCEKGVCTAGKQKKCDGCQGLQAWPRN